MTPDEIRRRLLGEDAIAELAVALVDDTLATPVGELLPSAAVANEIAEGLRAWVNSTGAQELVLAWEGRARKWLSSRAMTLGQLTGRAIEDAFLDLAALPYVPSREILIFLLDREPMRALLRELFLDALLAFGRKIRAPVVAHPVAKGLGGLGSFVRDRARSTALGAFATDVADRLADEVERQFEKRAIEFADLALSGLVARLADLLSEPARAEQQASLREAIVDGIFALQTSELAEEFDRSDPARRAAILRRGFGSWVATDDAVATIRTLVEGLLDGFAERPLGVVLEELELLDAYRGLALSAAGRRLRRLVEGEAFLDWLTRQLEKDVPA